MKNQIIIAAIALGAFVLGINNVNAQSNPVSTNVNIILSDVISIDEGSIASNGIVDFNYSNTTDYNTAKTVNKESSLVVTSSKNFDVKVKAEGENFKNGSNFIPVNVLQIKAVSGGSMTAESMNEIILSNADQILVGNANFGARKSLNIDYTISAENAKTVLLGKEPGTYTQKVTYTATVN